jgi:hypothetical protein
VTIADSGQPQVLFETALPPRYYLPLTHPLDLLRPSATQSHCPYTGTASYWSLAAGAAVPPGPGVDLLVPAGGKPEDRRTRLLLQREERPQRRRVLQDRRTRKSADSRPPGTRLSWLSEPDVPCDQRPAAPSRGEGASRGRRRYCRQGALPPRRPRCPVSPETNSMHPAPTPIVGPDRTDASSRGVTERPVMRASNSANRALDSRAERRLGARLFGRLITSPAFRRSWASRHDSERVLDIYADHRVPGMRAHAAMRVIGKRAIARFVDDSRSCEGRASGGLPPEDSGARQRRLSTVFGGAQATKTQLCATP